MAGRHPRRSWPRSRPSPTRVSPRCSEPFGVEPSWGYEIRYFDTAANKVMGGSPVTYREQVPPWSRLFDAPHRGVVSKISNYVSAPMAASAEVDEVFDEVLASSREVVIAYLGATDGFMHLYEDASLVEFLLDLDTRLTRLQRDHLEQRGRPLRSVLFSDHGCGRAPVHYTGDLRTVLRDAGLHPVDHLAGPLDVVVHTFGIVNYTALFMQDAGLADVAARALTSLPAVELAAYATALDSVLVLSDTGVLGSAGVTTPALGATPTTTTGETSCSSPTPHAGSTPGEGSAPTVTRTRTTGCARRRSAPTPTRCDDSPRRSRATGCGCRATVLASLGPGWSWGWRSAFVGGLVRGGRLKGTHGGLDRESTLGFFLTDDTVGGRAARGARRPCPRALRRRRPARPGLTPGSMTTMAAPVETFLESHPDAAAAWYTALARVTGRALSLPVLDRLSGFPSGEHGGRAGRSVHARRDSGRRAAGARRPPHRAQRQPLARLAAPATMVRAPRCGGGSRRVAGGRRGAAAGGGPHTVAARRRAAGPSARHVTRLRPRQRVPRRDRLRGGRRRPEPVPHRRPAPQAARPQPQPARAPDRPRCRSGDAPRVASSPCRSTSDWTLG